MLKGKIKRYQKNGLLTDGETTIANFIVKHYGPNLAEVSIKRMAYECNVSAATITRFMKKIGISGYKGFTKTVILESRVDHDHADTLSNDVQSMIQTKNLLSLGKIDGLAKIIDKIRNVKIYTSGFGLYLAKNFKRQLNKINIKTQVCNPYDVANIFQDEDVTILISLSGDNQNFKKIIKKIESFGSKLRIYSITADSHNTIKHLVNEHIHGSIYTDNTIANEKELPTITSIVIHYILNKLFERVYELRKSDYEKLIESIK